MIKEDKFEQQMLEFESFSKGQSTAVVSLSTNNFVTKTILLSVQVCTSELKKIVSC